MRSVKVMLTIGLGCVLAMGCDRYEDYTPEKGIGKDPVGGGNNACTGKGVPYETIAQGPGLNSGLKNDESQVITQQEEWANTWEAVKGAKGQVPEIDFSEKVVLAAFQGEKPNGGYAIEIEQVCKSGNTANAEVLNKVPKEGCPVTQGFTHPYHFVKVDRSKVNNPNDIKFNEQTVKHCNDGQGSQCSRVAFSEIKAGMNAAIDQAREEVVKSQARFDDFWGKIHGNSGSVPEPPEIDFQEKMVIGVFKGRKSNGGYGIEVTEACKQNGDLNVKVTNETPAEGCPVTNAISSYYQLVTVPKVQGAVQFDKETKTIDCE